jgi:hypothetical protein
MEYYNRRGRKRMALDRRKKFVFEGQTIAFAQLNMKASRFMMNWKNGGATAPIWKQICKNYLVRWKLL